MVTFSCWYLTSCKFGYLCGVKSPPLFTAVDRLSSHSEQSHWWLEGPREPMLENWPTTGQLSSTSTCKGPHTERTWQEEECTRLHTVCNYRILYPQNEDSPLNLEFCSLQTSLSLYMPFNAPPYLHFCQSSDSKTEPNFTSSLSKQTCDVNHAHSLTSMQWSALSIANTHLEPKKSSLPEMNPRKGESSVF